MKNSNLLFTILLSFLFSNLSAQKKGQETIQTSIFDIIPVRNIGPAKVSGRITKVIKDYSIQVWYVTTASEMYGKLRIQEQHGFQFLNITEVIQ